MDVKSGIASGRLATKISSLGSIILEDTRSCEAIKLMQMPDTFSFHEKGEWKPTGIYTSRSINHPMQCEEGWSCSVCGWTTFDKYDWCTCGADMRESNKYNRRLEELLETL